MISPSSSEDMKTEKRPLSLSPYEKFMCYPLKPKFIFLEYDKILSVKLKKGIIRSSIVFIIPGDTLQYDGLNKDKAAFMVDVIENLIRKHSKKREEKITTTNSKKL